MVNFVTGGTGLVGSHILLYLADAHEKIVALKRPNSDTSFVKSLFERNNCADKFQLIDWVDGDLTETNHLTKLMEGATHVYHCAALVSFDSNDRIELIETNIEGTSNLVDAALATQPKKLIYLSSTAAIGKQPKIAVIDEGCDWNPDNKNGVYSFSKHYAEREVWRGIEEGLNAVIINPAVILGPGKWGTSSTRMFNTVYDGLQFYTKGGNAFVDVRDVAKITIELAKSDVQNDRFLVFAENKSFREIMDKIAEGLGKSKAKYLATPAMGYFAGLFSEIWAVIGGKKPLITRDSSRSANATQVYSNEKIKSTLNYSFIPIDQSISDTCAIYLESKQQH